jgi:hypothetical protein
MESGSEILLLEYQDTQNHRGPYYYLSLNTLTIRSIDPVRGGPSPLPTTHFMCRNFKNQRFEALKKLKKSIEWYKGFFPDFLLSHSGCPPGGKELEIDIVPEVGN